MGDGSKIWMTLLKSVWFVCAFDEYSWTCVIGQREALLQAATQHWKAEKFFKARSWHVVN